MKTKLAIILAALFCFLGLMPAQSDAQGISISIGDRPYYNSNPYYVSHPNRYVWIPGHFVISHHRRTWRQGHWRARW